MTEEVHLMLTNPSDAVTGQSRSSKWYHWSILWYTTSERNINQTSLYIFWTVS